MQEWLYDYVLSFLKSPAWRVPILQFIDEHCILFDSEDENKLVYTEIHLVLSTQKFKEMIDKMLDSICTEISITPQLFVQACDRGLRTPTHKKIFEQIMACDNFLCKKETAFKKLMMKRNRELEEEAMKMLQQEEANVSYADEMIEAHQRKAQAEYEHALALSLAIENEKRRIHLTEDEELQRVLKLSEMEYQEMIARQKQKQLEEERKELEMRKYEMQSAMLQTDESSRREIEEAKRRAAGLTREEVLAQERNRAEQLKLEEERRRLEEERQSIEQLKQKMIDQQRQLDETKRREIEVAKKRAEEEARAQAEAMRRAEAQKTAEQRRAEEEAKVKILEELRRTDMENRWHTAVLEATQRGLKPGDPGYPVRSLPGFGLLPGQPGYPLRPGEEGYGVVAGLPSIPDEELRWREAVAAAEAAGLKPGQPGYPVRNLPAFGLNPGQPGYPYREGEVGYGIVPGVNGFADEEKRWNDAVRAAEKAGIRPGQPGYPNRNLPAFGLQPGQPGYPYKPGEPGFGVSNLQWTAATEEQRWAEAVQAAEKAGLRPGNPGYPVRNLPAFGLQPGQPGYPFRPNEPGYGGVLTIPPVHDEERRWAEAVRAAEAAGIRPGQPGYPIRSLPAFGLQPGQPGYPYRPGEPGFGIVPGQAIWFDEERRWQEAVKAAEQAGIRPGQPGYPVRNLPAFGLRPGQLGYPIKTGEPGYGLYVSPTGEVIVPGLDLTPQQKAAMVEAQRQVRATPAGGSGGVDSQGRPLGSSPGKPGAKGVSGLTEGRPGAVGPDGRPIPLAGSTEGRPGAVGPDGRPIPGSGPTEGRPGVVGSEGRTGGNLITSFGIESTPVGTEAVRPSGKAGAKKAGATASPDQPKQISEEEKRRREMEEKKFEEMKRVKEREAEDEMRRARESEWKKQQDEASQRAKEKTALPPVMLKKAAPIGEIPLSELQKGKVDISSEQLEAENLRKKAEDILRNNEGTELDAPESSHGVESLAKRQERLRRQRDLLLAKKKAERERELKEYLDQGGKSIGGEAEGQQVTSEEMEKRKNIASKIKQSLLSG